MTDPRITKIIEALDNAATWNRGDKWRDSKDERDRDAWKLHQDSLDAALTAARSLAAGGAAPAQPAHVSVGRAGDFYAVRLTIGVQSFTINGKQESEEHAQWTASMLRKALSNAALPHHQPQASCLLSDQFQLALNDVKWIYKATLPFSDEGPASRAEIESRLCKVAGVLEIALAASPPSGDTATVDAKDAPK